MSADVTGQHRWRRIGWLLYLVGYCLMAGDYPGVGLVVFALGMLCLAIGGSGVGRCL